MPRRRAAPPASRSCLETLRQHAQADRPPTPYAVSKIAELTRQLNQVRSELFVAMQGLGDGPASDVSGNADMPPSLEPMAAQRHDGGKLIQWCEHAATHVALLTPRQHEVMTLVVAGRASKRIAADLNISRRTVENHRASIMRKTGAASLPALARLALAAGWAAAEG